jgi:hypothetical protein
VKRTTKFAEILIQPLLSHLQCNCLPYAMPQLQHQNHYPWGPSNTYSFTPSPHTSLLKHTAHPALGRRCTIENIPKITQDIVEMLDTVALLLTTGPEEVVVTGGVRQTRPSFCGSCNCAPRRWRRRRERTPNPSPPSYNPRIHLSIKEPNDPIHRRHIPFPHQTLQYKHQPLYPKTSQLSLSICIYSRL